jgi:hypothetical protein
LSPPVLLHPLLLLPPVQLRKKISSPCDRQLRLVVVPGRS